MWTYEKRLQYPVKIARPNPKLAKVIISQFGGPDGELAAAVKPINGANGLIEGLLCQVLRQIRVLALSQEEFIDRLGVLLVDLMHIVHRTPPFTCYIHF